MNSTRRRWWEFTWTIPFTRHTISVEYSGFGKYLWWWNAWAFRGSFVTNRVLRVRSVLFRLRSK